MTARWRRARNPTRPRSASIPTPAPTLPHRRLARILAALHEAVSQVDGGVRARGFHLMLDGGFDLAGGGTGPLPCARTAYALAEYPLAHPEAGIRDVAIAEEVTKARLPRLRIPA